MLISKKERCPIKIIFNSKRKSSPKKKSTNYKNSILCVSTLDCLNFLTLARQKLYVTPRYTVERTKEPRGKDFFAGIAEALGDEWNGGEKGSQEDAVDRVAIRHPWRKESAAPQSPWSFLHEEIAPSCPSLAGHIFQLVPATPSGYRPATEIAFTLIDMYGRTRRWNFSWCRLFSNHAHADTYAANK